LHCAVQDHTTAACSSVLQVQELYSKAIAAGIPCHLNTRVEFFDAPEVKVALALLRCLVDPLRAGDNIRKRLVIKGIAVKVPLMAGLGERWPQNNGDR
jgi:superfamily I DNA/RNA helicase